MSTLFNKYDNVFNDIFKNKTNDIESNVEISENIEKMPEPSEYRISTMTMITTFGCNINLDVVDKYFEVDNVIISMDYGHKPVKSSTIKKRKNKRPFFNQATMIVKLDPLKKINVKIFSNGKIQMTGVKKESDCRLALNIIIKRLEKTNGKVNIKKLLVSHQSEILQKYLNRDFMPLSEYYYNKDDKTDSLIIDSKKVYQHLISVIFLKKSKNYTFPLPIDFYKKNVILMKNYDEEITYEADTNKMYELLEENDISYMAYSIENQKEINIGKIETVLINSDFNVNFKIKRNILHSILKDDYQIVSRFEPGIYPGVNNKYYFNRDYLNKEHKGRCYCTKKCEGKGTGKGNGECKKITIAAFQSGSIIITGAREIEHIIAAKNFITNVLKENYDLVRKIDAPFIDIDTSDKQPPKKYIKTSDIFYINRKSLDNELNKNIYPRYLKYIEMKQKISLKN